MVSSGNDEEARFEKMDQVEFNGSVMSTTDTNVKFGTMESVDEAPLKSCAVSRYAVSIEDVANPKQVKTCNLKVHRNEKDNYDASQDNAVAMSDIDCEFSVNFVGIHNGPNFPQEEKEVEYAKQKYEDQMRHFVSDDDGVSAVKKFSFCTIAQRQSQGNVFRHIQKDAVGNPANLDATSSNRTTCDQVCDYFLSSSSFQSWLLFETTKTTEAAVDLATLQCSSAAFVRKAYRNVTCFKKAKTTIRYRGPRAATTFFVALVMACCRTLSICHGQENLHQDSCGVYLAPSTIPGAGLGMFAGQFPYKEGDKIGDSDIMIPVYELDWHNGNDKYDFLWDEYTWSTSMFPEMEDDIEQAIDESSIISSGFGAAVNCMIPLVNVRDHEGPDGYHMTTSGVASQSPGAGAFTPMTGRVFEAKKLIEPFSELYADYGSEYFTGRYHYRSIPLKDDYVHADRLVRKYLKLLNERSQNANVVKDGGYQEKVEKHVSGLEQDLWDLIINTRQVWSKSRILHALPGKNTSLKDLENLMDFGGTKMQHYNISIKTKEWMDEFGQCMDNIKDGISGIPHAGRGAFARRFIAEGGLVSPAPLVHLPNRSSLITYKHYIDEEGQWRRNVSAPIHHQLLLNYCFGHSRNSLLLCPYGMFNFLINHDSIDPNTKIQWSKNQRHPEWFDLPVEKWGNTMHNGLSMDFVALRDIQPGEEITIDYGPEWEEAWQDHVRKFDIPRPKYTPAFELNKIVDLIIPTLWNDDGLPPLESVLTFCRDFFFPPDFDVDPYYFGFSGEEEYGEFFLCRALYRNETTNTYTAEVLKRESWRKNKLHDIYETVVDTPVMILFDLPRDAFLFRDVHYSRDHHQTWSFRHDMRIPDDMVPELWKNTP